MSDGVMASELFLWRPPATPIVVFARAGIDAVRARIDGIEGLEHATVHATLVPPPSFSLVPFRSVPVALVTLRGSHGALFEARARLEALPGRLEGWRARTTVPVAARAPADTVLLTLFRRARHVDAATFLRRWHDEHTPLTLEIHPVVGYVRHEVTSSIEPGSAAWDGIVTEDFAAPEDLTTLRLFGRGPRALLNAVRIGLHVRTFLDLGSIETYLVRERRL